MKRAFAAGLIIIALALCGCARQQYATLEEAVLVEEEEPPQAVRAAAAAAAPATARKLRREIIIRKLSFLYIKNCALKRECAHLHIY